MGVKFNPFTSKLDIVDSPSGEFSDIELALGTQEAPSLSFTGDPNTGIYSPGADQVAISTGGTGRLFVDASGRVGAGTNTPTTPLHVYNASTGLLLNLVSGQNNAGIQFANSGATDTIQIVSRNNNLEFRTDLGSYKWKTNNAASDAMVIDSSGRVGIGTATPGSALEINAAASTSPFIAKINTSEVARIDSSGRLLVGTSSARTLFTGFTPTVQVETATSATANISIVSTQDIVGGANFWLGHARGANGVLNSGDELGALLFNGGDGTDIQSIGAKIAVEVDGTPGANDMPGRFVFSTTADGAASPTERMRIDSTGRIFGYTGGLEITRTVDSVSAVANFISSSATTANQYGLYIRLDGDPNNTGQYFLECFGDTTRRATIRSNGGLANYQSNNVDLSDERTKRDIASAPSTWDCVQAWNVVNYNYLDDAQDELARIGVIAQQVQQHCPEVIIPYQEAKDAVLDGDGSVVTPAIEERLGVREQQMMWMAIKALQEAQTRIETLEAKVNALEGN